MKMANEQNSSGFNLSSSKPEGQDVSKPTTAELPPDTVSTSVIRDNLIADGILVVLVIAFFFVKNAFADSLVAKRIFPNKANMAGWGLFVFLTSAATAGVLAVANASKFLTFLYMLPLAIAAFVGLFLTYTNSRN